MPFSCTVILIRGLYGKTKYKTNLKKKKKIQKNKHPYYRAGQQVVKTETIASKL